MTDAGLGRQAERLGTLAVRDIVPPARSGSGLTVLRHLDEAVRLAARPPTDDLAAALATVASVASWTQTSIYVDNPPGPGFLDQYAHATVAGHPDGTDTGTRPDMGAALGLLLLGPAVLYPPHRHPADEVYLPLTGAKWLHGSGSYRDEPAGALLHHPAWQPHGVRTSGQPLMAVYLWTGDVRTPSTFC